MSHLHTLPHAISDEPPRYLTRDACDDVFRRVLSFTRGSGATRCTFDSAWHANTRWALNRVISSGDVRDHGVTIFRGPSASRVNAFDEVTLRRAVADVEFDAARTSAFPDLANPRDVQYEYLNPPLWYERSYKQEPAERSELARQLVTPVLERNLLSAGYIEVGASSIAVRTTGGTTMYSARTEAQVSITVRSPDGSASGWAGASHWDWARLDAAAIARSAFDKCVAAANPVTVEPGRYTTILEPQATHDLTNVWYTLDRHQTELTGGPFAGLRPGTTKLGQKIIDERLTVRTDLMDPEMSQFPFDTFTNEPNFAKPVTWIADGVLTNMWYSRSYAVEHLVGVNTPQRFAGTFRMEGRGPTVSVDEMIASTLRGVLVTRFSNVGLLDQRSLLMSGYTRDGTWLIEKGKITHAIKNLRFVESPLFALNNVEAIGTPERIFSPGAPAMVPALKVRDFSFTALSDAI